MRKTHLLVAAALLGSSAAYGSDAAAKPVARQKAVQTIHVEILPDSEPLSCYVVKKDWEMHVRQGDKIEWELDEEARKLGGKLIIVWYAGDPTRATRATKPTEGRVQGRDLNSVSISKDAKPGTYYYGFVLRFRDGRACMHDPRMVIDL